MFVQIVQLGILLPLFIAMITVKKSGKIPPIRKLPATEALDEAVGKASEMGLHVHATT